MNELNDKTMYVKIPVCPNHYGFQGFVRKIKISAFCPKCGKPRGKVIHNMRSYDGSRFVICDGWTNPCGHIDYYEEVVKEFKNGKAKRV